MKYNIVFCFVVNIYGFCLIKMYVFSLNLISAFLNRPAFWDTAKPKAWTVTKEWLHTTLEWPRKSGGGGGGRVAKMRWCGSGDGGEGEVGLTLPPGYLTFLWVKHPHGSIKQGACRRRGRGRLLKRRAQRNGIFLAKKKSFSTPLFFLSAGKCPRMHFCAFMPLTLQGFPTQHGDKLCGSWKLSGSMYCYRLLAVPPCSLVTLGKERWLPGPQNVGGLLLRSLALLWGLPCSKRPLSPATGIWGGIWEGTWVGLV